MRNPGFQQDRATLNLKNSSDFSRIEFLIFET